MDWLFIENTGDISANNGPSTWGNASHWSPAIIPGGVGKKVTFPATASGTLTIDDNVTLQFLVYNNTNGALQFNTSTGKIFYFQAKAGTGNCIISGTTIRANTCNCNIVLLSNLDVTFNGGQLTCTGVISGSVNITKSGTSVLILNGVNTFIGTLNFTDGTVTVNSDSSFGNAANAVTFAGALFDINANVVITRNITFQNAMTLSIGSFSLEFAGSYSGTGGFSSATGATILISGTWSCSGSTAINSGSLTISGTHSGTGAFSAGASGTLVVNGSLSSSTGTLSLTGVAVLKGTGTIAKFINITSTPTLEPGNGGVGTLTCTNGVTMSTTGIFSIRTSGATASKLAITGNVTIRGTYSLQDSSLTAGTYDIITYTGTATVTTLTSSGVNNTGRTITFFHDTVNKKYQMIAV